jgi:hypothetical protein
VFGRSVLAHLDVLATERVRDVLCYFRRAGRERDDQDLRIGTRRLCVEIPQELLFGQIGVGLLAHAFGHRPRGNDLALRLKVDGSGSLFDLRR